MVADQKEVIETLYAPGFDFLFSPDPVMPSQFYNKLMTDEPERRLRLAVLDDVFQLFRRRAAGKCKTRAYGRKELADAEAWVKSDDLDWPYSFTNVCDALGLEPTRVRAVLLAVQGDDYHQRHRSDVAPRMPIVPPARCTA